MFFGWPAVPGVHRLVSTATGWVGLGIVFVYSVLVAFALPLPSELVLLAPLRLGVSARIEFALIVLVSAVGKAAGSVVALTLGEEATGTGYGRRALSRLGLLEYVAAVEERAGDFVREHGYLGLLVVLSIPVAPDTASIYAFSPVETSYPKFCGAAFAGSVIRLLIVAAVARGALTLL